MEPPVQMEMDRPDSCEFSINAKMAWSGSVKCYRATLEEAMNEAKKRAEEMESIIAQKNAKQGGKE